MTSLSELKLYFQNGSPLSILVEGSQLFCKAITKLQELWDAQDDDVEGCCRKSELDIQRAKTNSLFVHLVTALEDENEKEAQWALEYLDLAAAYVPSWEVFKKPEEPTFTEKVNEKFGPPEGYVLCEHDFVEGVGCPACEATKGASNGDS